MTLLRQEEVIALRKKKLTGCHISSQTGLSRATVSRILRCAKLSRWCQIEPAASVVRYERAHPGELLQIDIKKLVRMVRLATASPAIAATPSRAMVGSMSLSPSTTTRAWLTPPSIPTNNAPAPSRS